MFSQVEQKYILRTRTMIVFLLVGSNQILTCWQSDFQEIVHQHKVAAKSPNSINSKESAEF